MSLRARDLHPVVAIPARNEAERLPRLLAALNRQSWMAGGEARLPVVVVLNNCTDDSHAVLTAAAAQCANLALDVIEIDFPRERAHAGSARRLAMDRACDRCPPDVGVVLTTDADARPEREWVAANLGAVALGADIVGGKLYGNRDEEAQLGPGFALRAQGAARYAALCDRLASLIDPLDHDPWPRHGDHTGGSLAIRADLYRAVGGVPPLPFREDLALVSKARAFGGRLVHPLDVRVEVSARLAGRAEGGMADCLKAWLRAETEGLPLLVEDPSRVENRLVRRRAIRDRAAAAHDPQVDVAGRRHPAALVEELAPDEPDAPGTVPVALATARLVAMIQTLEGGFRAA